MELSRKELERLSVMDLSLWMKGKGVQDSYCELFEGKKLRLFSCDVVMILHFAAISLTLAPTLHISFYTN